MKKTIALVLTTLLILTILLTTSNFTPTVIAPAEPKHWKIILAQKNCNAKIEGNLTDLGGSVIPGTNFVLTCNQSFVFAKVKNATASVNYIDYYKWIDWDKVGGWDVVAEHHHDALQRPTQAYNTTWYKRDETQGDKMVVVEVEEQPYRQFFQWQISLYSKNSTEQPMNATLSGNLTDGTAIIPGTEFNLKVGTDYKPPEEAGHGPGGTPTYYIHHHRSMGCVVVRTPWCTVPKDIDWSLVVTWENGTKLNVTMHRDIITQFPWVWEKKTAKNEMVTIELTEVYMNRFILVGGETNSAGQLGINHPWRLNEWTGQGQIPVKGGVPFATRAPNLKPMESAAFPQLKTYGQNVTFTQRDPITGIVNLGVPPESYAGVDHIYYSPRLLTYFRVRILVEDQGYGWLFTGQGRSPVFGDVDVITWSNNTGVYSNRTGELMHILPKGQGSTGPDGIPGTRDAHDPFGDGTDDPAGSVLLLLPSKLVVTFWDKDLHEWCLLFESPWPQPLTTAKASDIVIEPLSALNPGPPIPPIPSRLPYKANATVQGAPMEFRAGLKGIPGSPVVWNHPYSNAFMTTVTVWASLETPTNLGFIDVLFYVVQRSFRDDIAPSLPDIITTEIPEAPLEITVFDVARAAKGYGTSDEGIGPDGIPGTADDRGPDGISWTYDDGQAMDKYDAGADVSSNDLDAEGNPIKLDGTLNIFDVSFIAKYYGKKLTTSGIQ